MNKSSVTTGRTPTGESCPRIIEPATRTAWAVAATAIAVFLLLTVGYSVTRAPWWDEGVFADIAVTFRSVGHLGSTTFASNGYQILPGADQYTYWQMPLYPVICGLLLHLFPPSVQFIRLVSVFCGCIYIGSWFLLIRSLSRNETLALIVASVVALDYSLVAAASDGRMDMMAAALGQAALAVYAYFRDTNWKRAVALSAWFAAASLFCHPAAVIPNALLAAMILMDWRRIRASGLLFGLVPYLTGIALCAWYALRAPAIFAAQVHSLRYRTSTASSTLLHLVYDFQERYLNYYLLGLTGINKLKVLSLVFAFIGVIGLVFVRRPVLQRLRRTLLIFSVVAYVALAAVDNMELPVYFIYSIPVFAACGAVWVYESWRTSGWRRIVACGLLIGAAGTTIGGFGYKIYKNDYRNQYLPAVAEIRKDLQPGGILMGGSELGFAFGFHAPLVDDRYLGYFSGLRPQVYVMNSYYVEMPEPRLQKAWIASRQILRKQYRLVFQNASYRIYLRK